MADGGGIKRGAHSVFRKRREDVRALWSLCRCERKREEGVSRRHGDHGVFLEEVEKRFERCGRCVAVREKEEEGVSRRHSVHGVFRRSGEAVRALWSLCRCEKKEEEGVSRRHGDHGVFRRSAKEVRAL